MAGRELGEHERPNKGERTTQHPRDEREPGAAQLARDLPGRPKNSRAHHDADDHGEAVEKTKRPF